MNTSYVKVGNNPYKNNPLLATQLLDDGDNLLRFGYDPESYVDEFVPYYRKYAYYDYMLIKQTAWTINLMMNHHGLK